MKPRFRLTIPGCLVAIVLAISGSSARAAFTEHPDFGDGYTIPVAWGDCDGDGDLDLAVGNFTQQNKLYINQGDGSFAEEDQFGRNRTIAMAWGDCDNDGDLDLAVGNGILGVTEQNFLYINTGDGSFTEEAQFGEGQTGSVAWGDYDQDGDLDLAVGNGGFGSSAQNYLYENAGNGTFSERLLFGAEDTACLAWGDTTMTATSISPWATGMAIKAISA